jgi:hypothetical protein
MRKARKQFRAFFVGPMLRNLTSHFDDQTCHAIARYGHKNAKKPIYKGVFPYFGLV